MVFRYLILLLTLNHLANGIDEKTSKVLSCMHQSQLRKSMAIGNRTWVVPDQFDPGQDVICSHLSTSDGIRMCACMCETDLKRFSDDNQISWIVPKYRRCGELQSAIDFKIYCYDLVTSDGNRMCSCTCSTVKKDMYDIGSITAKIQEVIDNDIRRPIVENKGKTVESGRASLIKSAYNPGVIAVGESDKVAMKGLINAKEEMFTDNIKPDIILGGSNIGVEQEPDIFQEPLLNEIATLLTTPDVDTTTVTLTVSSGPETTDHDITVTTKEINESLVETNIHRNEKENQDGQHMAISSGISQNIQSDLQMNYEFKKLAEMAHSFNPQVNQIEQAYRDQSFRNLEKSQENSEDFTKYVAVTETHVENIDTTTKLLMYDNSLTDGLVIYEPTTTNLPSPQLADSITEPEIVSTTNFADETRMNIGPNISSGNVGGNENLKSTKSMEDITNESAVSNTETIQIDSQNTQKEEVDSKLGIEAITQNSLNELSKDIPITKGLIFYEPTSTTESSVAFEVATTTLYDGVTSTYVSNQNLTNVGDRKTGDASEMFSMGNERISSKNYQSDFEFNHIKNATDIEDNSTRLLISDKNVPLEHVMEPSEIPQETTETVTVENIQESNTVLTTMSPLSSDYQVSTFSPEESTESKTTSKPTTTFTAEDTSSLAIEHTTFKNSDSVSNSSVIDETLIRENHESEEILIIDLNPQELSGNKTEFQQSNLENSTFSETTLTAESSYPSTPIQAEPTVSPMVISTETNLNLIFQELLENNDIMELNSTHHKLESILELGGNSSASNYTTTQTNDALDKSIDPILYTETLNNPKSGLNLNLEFNEPNRKIYADNIELKDNVLVVYPSGGYINRKAKANGLQRFPKQPNYQTRNKKDNEKIFYVYSQSVAESPKITETPANVSLVMPQRIEKPDLNFEQPEKMSKQNVSTSTLINSEVESNTPVSADTTHSQSTEALGDSTTEALNAVIEVPTAVDIEQATAFIAEPELSDPSLVQSNQNSSESDYFEIGQDTEDESVTIAYSGKVYQTVSAENFSDASAHKPPLTIPVYIIMAETIATTTRTEPRQNVSSTSLQTDILQTASLSSTTETSGSSTTSDSIEGLSTNTSSGRKSLTTSAISSSLSNASNTSSTVNTTSTEISTTASSSTTSTTSTFYPAITSTTGLPFSLTTLIPEVKTINPMLPEDVKLKRQNQFMEFLKKRSQEPSRSRHPPKEYKRPTTTRVPLVGIRQIFKDVSNRRSSFIKTRGKIQPVENKNTGINDDQQNVTESSARNASRLTTTLDTPKPTNPTKQRDGIAIRRRSLLRIRTTTASLDD